MSEAVFLIERGVPLPPGRSTSVTATLRRMEIGDSFFFRSDQRVTVSNAAVRQPPKRFSIRAVEENGKRGCRVTGHLLHPVMLPSPIERARVGQAVAA